MVLQIPVQGSARVLRVWGLKIPRTSAREQQQRDFSETLAQPNPERFSPEL